MVNGVVGVQSIIIAIILGNAKGLPGKAVYKIIINNGVGIIQNILNAKTFRMNKKGRSIPLIVKGFNSLFVH